MMLRVVLKEVIGDARVPRDARELSIYAMWNELKGLLTRMTRDACRSRDARVLCVLDFRV